MCLYSEARVPTRVRRVSLGVQENLEQMVERARQEHLEWMGDRVLLDPRENLGARVRGETTGDQALQDHRSVDPALTQG